MATPFDQAYDSRDEMLTALRNYAFSRGYIMTTIRSNPGKNITIGCDRGGEHTNRINTPDRATRRKTSTRQIGYSFRLYGYVYCGGSKPKVGMSIIPRRAIISDPKSAVCIGNL